MLNGGGLLSEGWFSGVLATAKFQGLGGSKEKGREHTGWEKKIPKKRATRGKKGDANCLAGKLKGDWFDYGMDI